MRFALVTPTVLSNVGGVALSSWKGGELRIGQAPKAVTTSHITQRDAAPFVSGAQSSLRQPQSTLGSYTHCAY